MPPKTKYINLPKIITMKGRLIKKIKIAIDGDMFYFNKALWQT